LKRILIANRGEIACRIAHTARKLGIGTVAVFSEADANSRHVSMCDSAVAIGPADARKSYLDIGKIIDAARSSGADAVHPGYGFLAENAELAQACAFAGLNFIGPNASVIRLMADKATAKEQASKAGFPLVPGYYGEVQDKDFLKSQALEIGYPVMIKARNGGGGRGLRVVREESAFEAALESCMREALVGFGNDAVMLERYMEQPRHIEIQILGDQHGNVLHLYERDCSLQRRHQKVIEESPALGLNQEQRQAMGEAAANLAKTIGYVGVGTIECIVDQGGQFHFLEMNTRLQVEHGVTEMITGIDLVEWQIRVAQGEKLPMRQDQIITSGHCIEARICAERPEKGFLPSTGRITELAWPDHAAFTNADVRIDSGVRQKDEVSPFYDSMLSKVLVRADTRDQAVQNMRRALSEVRIEGVKTNLEFLSCVFEHPDFVKGAVDTGFIERNLKQLLEMTRSRTAA